MKTVKLSKTPMRGGVVEVPDPKPKDDIVVVKVHSAPMCTEYRRFMNGGLTDELNPGHEAAGEVAFVDKATQVKVGDRVIVQPSSACGQCPRCRQGDFIHCQNQKDYLEITGSESGKGTMAQYMLKAEHLLVKIPDGMSYDMASMGCCALGPSFTAMERMNVNSFDTVLVSGLGPVGLGAVINATFRGARVIGVDSNSFRSDLAKELGASLVLDPRDPEILDKIRDFTGGEGADKSVETSGVPAAKKLLLDCLRCRGQAAIIGWGGDLSADTIIGKGLTVHGCWHYNLNDAGKVIAVIAHNQEKLEKLITHRFPLSKVTEAWTVQASGNCGKVVLHPWEE